MGNKRKAVAIILGVVVFAAGIISGAFLAFKPNRSAETVQAVTYTVANGQSVTQTRAGGKNTYTWILDPSRTYYVELAGGKGASATDFFSGFVGGYGGKGGQGAVMYGFCRPNSTIGIESQINYTDYGFGGLTSFNLINFAVAGNSNSLQGVAGGGGSAGLYLKYGISDNGNILVCDGGNAGIVGCGNESSLTVDINSLRASGGGGGTQSKAGNGGSAYVNYNNQYKVGSDGSGMRGGAGHLLENYYLSYGGWGYYGGGAGGYATTEGSGPPARIYAGGGGASSSPNLYYKGLNNDKGYLTVTDITPTANPTLSASRVNYGGAFTVNGGTAKNPNSVCQWQYSLNNSTWQTSNSFTAQSSGGTQKVYWRYVVPADSSINRPEAVIASGSLDLQVGPAQGTVSAPTLTGNGSATYSGNDIQVVTAAGQSSGTFTFATAKTKDEE